MDSASSNVNQVKTKSGSIGLVLRQPSQRESKYLLHRVFFSVQASDYPSWKGWLLREWADRIEDAKVDVSIFNPPSNGRRLAVDISFQLEINVGEGQEEEFTRLGVCLSAVPFVAKDVYDFRLRIATAEYGLSLQQVIGLGSTEPFIKTDLPIIKDVLNTVYVYNVSLGLARVEGKWVLSDGSFCMGLPIIRLIKDKLSLSLVDLTLRKYNDEMECSLSGTLVLRKKDQNSNQSDQVKHIEIDL